MSREAEGTAGHRAYNTKKHDQVAPLEYLKWTRVFFFLFPPGVTAQREPGPPRARGL